MGISYDVRFDGSDYLTDDKTKSGEKQVVKLKVVLEMWDTGYVYLEVPNDKLGGAQFYDMFYGADGEAGQGKTLEVWRNRGSFSKKLIKAIIDDVRVTDMVIKVWARGSGIKLVWDTCDAFEEYIATEARTVLSNLIAGTGITLAAGDNYGNISVGFQEGTNIWRAVMATIKNTCGWEGMVNADDELVFVSQLGSDKSATVVFEYGVNILFAEKQTHTRDLANWVKGRGRGEGVFQLTSGPVEDAASQAKFGKRKRVFDARDAEYQDDLDKRRDNVLAAYKDPIHVFREVDVVDAYTFDFDCDIGDTVRIKSPPHGIDANYRLFKIEYDYSTAGERIHLVVGNVAESLAEESAKLSYRLDIEKFYPQGAPMISNFGLTAPVAVDDTHDIEFDFKIPDVADWDVKIQDCLISVVGKTYRIWSKGAASGGGTTQTSSAGGGQTKTSDVAGTDHVHWVATPLWGSPVGVSEKQGFARVGITYNSGAFKDLDIKLDVPNLLDDYWWTGGPRDKSGGVSPSHSHNVTIDNHTHDVTIPNHTHNPEPGIYETTDYPVDVEVWVNGTKVADKTTHPDLAGGAAFTVEDIDIKSYVTTGKNTIVLKSTGVGSLGMLAAPGFYRIFARSK
jgi:hypothetical protein